MKNAKIALPKIRRPDKLRGVSPPAHRRFFPLAASLLALACLLAAPPRAAAVMTPPAKIASWGFDHSPSGRPGDLPPANQDGIRGYGLCAYEPASGRPEWLSRDPIEEQGGWNLYGFVANDAVSRYDALGLSDAAVMSGAAAAGGGASAILSGIAAIGDAIPPVAATIGIGAGTGIGAIGIAGGLIDITAPPRRPRPVPIGKGKGRFQPRTEPIPVPVPAVDPRVIPKAIPRVEPKKDQNEGVFHYSNKALYSLRPREFVTNRGDLDWYSAVSITFLSNPCQIYVYSVDISPFLVEWGSPLRPGVLQGIVYSYPPVSKIKTLPRPPF